MSNFLLDIFKNIEQIAFQQLLMCQNWRILNLRGGKTLNLPIIGLAISLGAGLGP